MVAEVRHKGLVERTWKGTAMGAAAGALVGALELVWTEPPTKAHAMKFTASHVGQTILRRTIIFGSVAGIFSSVESFMDIATESTSSTNTAVAAATAGGFGAALIGRGPTGIFTTALGAGIAMAIVDMNDGVLVKPDPRSKGDHVVIDMNKQG